MLAQCRRGGGSIGGMRPNSTKFYALARAVLAPCPMSAYGQMVDGTDGQLMRNVSVGYLQVKTSRREMD